ncbi:hypothetical protein VNO77_08654 [Canavalia gladiata]|uniref:RING-type domain-containing protein n=1 Tax=Canavalia gladiata TaxID=3824 RepID=A0AAN9M9C2_CANGL
MEHTTSATPTKPPLPLAVTLSAVSPPVPCPCGYVDLSPFEFILFLVAIITIPALVYTFIFVFGCPSGRHRPEQNSIDVSDNLHNGDATSVSNVRYWKEVNGKEVAGDCPVCLSSFADGEKLRQLNACKHLFHVDCINLWLSNHFNCPICRATVAGKRPLASAPARDQDLQQGLPDASALV